MMHRPQAQHSAGEGRPWGRDVRRLLASVGVEPFLGTGVFRSLITMVVLLVAVNPKTKTPLAPFLVGCTVIIYPTIKMYQPEVVWYRNCKCLDTDPTTTRCVSLYTCYP
jgi:hypothetical protein